MATNTTCQRLAETIIGWLRQGITLTADVLAFIEATYSAPPEQVLATLPAAADGAETDALVELIFFPDQALQATIEPLLAGQAFDTHDARYVAQHLAEQMPRVNFYLPHGSRPYVIRLEVETAHTLVARLRITKTLTPEIEQALQAHVNADDQLRVRLAVRNSNWQPTFEGAEVLLYLFQNIDSKREEFWPFLDFVLVCQEEIGASGNVHRRLMARKERLEHQLHKTVRYERQRAQHNIETLMLQGERAPFCDVNQLQQQLHMLATVLQWLPGDAGMQRPAG